MTRRQLVGGAGISRIGSHKEEIEGWPSTLVETYPNRVELEHPYTCWNQRKVPCCVACATSTAMEILDARSGSTTRLSPLFAYYVSRRKKSELENVTLVRALKSAHEDGIAPLQAHTKSFQPAAARDAPTANATRTAQGFKLRRHHLSVGGKRRRAFFPLPRRSDIRSWITAILYGYPIIITFRMGQDYRDIHPTNPTLTERYGTGDRHAVVVLGYDAHRLGATNGALRVKDSRGESFGETGHWWLPFDLAQTSRVREAWVLTALDYTNES